MATAVEEALAEGRHLVVEAGTGVGKSFAYLVPILQRIADGGGPIIIATRTIALQEQLVLRDLPTLIGALKSLNLPEIPFALVKGRGNYVCRRRLEMAHAEGAGSLDENQFEQIGAVRAWAERSRDGSLADLPFKPDPAVWEAARAEAGNCLHKRCEFYESCAYQRSRREMFQAKLLIANHAIVFADLAVREAGGKFLPDYEALVLDEAHEAEEGAAEHFGVSVSGYAVSRQIARLAGSGRRGGLFDLVDAPRGMRAACAEVRDASKDLFQSVERLRGKASEARMRRPGEFADPLSRPLLHLVRELKEHHGSIKDPGLALEWKARADRLEDIAHSVQLVHSQADPDLVYWAEGRGRRDRSVLRAAPVEVAAVLRRTLFRRARSVVLTSATLRVGGSFEHLQRRLGLQEPVTLGLGSPFDFRKQCRLVLYPSLPDPREAGFEAGSIDAIRKLVLESGGGAFLLFTSHRALQHSHAALEKEFRANGMRVMRQGGDLRQQQIVDEFRKDRNCVLFATDTFWQGIDVRGENLRLVVLSRLPFAVPDHPLQQARTERVEDNDGDPFRELSLPQAVLKLRQGFGRLIRSHEDRGTVAILDPRVVTKWYGRTFLKSLPDCKVERR